MTVAVMDDGIPNVDWNTFYNHFTMGAFAWRQGEHVALIGPTGCGKTTLAHAVLPQRKHVVILGTKPKDTSLDRFVDKAGFRRIEKWNGKVSAARFPKRLLWPPVPNMRAKIEQANQFSLAIEDIYAQGSWCLYVDELYYLTNELGLGPYVKTYLLQARSNDISLVLATQRPRWVPVETFSQSTHIFFWRTRDANDLKRIDGIASHDSNLVYNAIRNLDRETHEFLYVNQTTGHLVRSAAPNPEGG